MKEKELYTGRIDECLDAYGYLTYGQERLVLNFILGKMKEYTLQRYTKQAYTNAILLKVTEEDYIWLNAPINETTPFMQRLGILQKHISTTPEKDHDLFVVKESLTPYIPAPTKKTNPFSRKRTKPSQKDK